MSTKLILQAHVTDTNHRPRGVMSIKVEFHQDAPWSVEHNGQSYFFTGKSGTNDSTGDPVRELSTDDDARLWITLDGLQVWED